MTECVELWEVDDEGRKSPDGEHAAWRHQHDQRLMVVFVLVIVAVSVMTVTMTVALFRLWRLRNHQRPLEHPEIKTERVISGGECRDQQKDAKHGAHSKCRADDFILGEESAEPGNSRQSRTSDKNQHVGMWQDFLDAAHPPHVQFPAHGVHHDAGGKEQQCFEEGVRDQVKHPRHRRCQRSYTATNMKPSWLMVE